MNATEFLNKLFGELPDGEAVAIARDHVNQQGKNTKWCTPFYPGRSEVAPEESNVPQFYCISTMRDPDVNDSYLTRRNDNFAALYVVLFDDVGDLEKCPKSDSIPPPTYKMETSSDNFQWGIALDPPIEDINHAKYLLKQLGKHGYGDPKATLPINLARLPRTWHATKDFRAVLTEFTDERYYSPDELCDLLDIPKYDPSKVVEVSRGSQKLTDIDDPIYLWLVEKGYVDSISPDFVNVACFAADEHSEGGTDLVGYSPLGYGRIHQRNANCFHGHAGNPMTLDRFLDWVEREGGPNIRTPKSLLDEFVSITQGDCWGLTKLQLSGPQSLVKGDSAMRRRYKISIKDLNAIRVSDGLRTAHDIHYHPARDKYYYDKVAREYYFNTYSPPIHRCSGGDSTLFFEHLAHLYPDADDYRYVRNWCALQVQQPGHRICSIITIDPQGGTGKGMFADMMGRILGAHNVGSTKLHDLCEPKWHDVLEGKMLLIVNESKHLEKRAEFFAIYEGLKEVIDDTPRRVMGNFKFYPVREYTQFFMACIFSNNSDAIRLPLNDRRFYVTMREAGFEKPADYYARIAKSLQNKNDLTYTAAYNDLLSIELSDEDVYELHNPPHTEAKQRLYEDTRTDTEDIVEETIKMLPGAVTNKDQLLRACINFSGRQDGHDRLRLAVIDYLKKCRLKRAKNVRYRVIPAATNATNFDAQAEFNKNISAIEKITRKFGM